ncbi:Cof-type HAD-IIB family hydrolase [Mycoplasma cottewii]|uniref:Cof-type HAD-IIB family hydrolase n=1 Tax=Mycoplasma cottewii TaxID=51364 RepID=A0ABY5TWQ3_9MOLU|nr:Cof-type HAD-IIB family hydrolase [Mycoplasma cottewii]UWD35113.1 Cof-type HAD-IIB family hydrolase [Mycoplasma cottewii]
MKLKRLDVKRLILVDLDGTVLTNSNDKIHPVTKQALQDAVKRGHTVCVVTGRAYRAMKHIYKELNLDTVVATFDGAHIHDPKKKQLKRIILPINNDIIMQIINEPVIKENVENILIEYYNKTLIWKDDKDLYEFFHLYDVEAKEETKIFIEGSPYELWNDPSNNLVIKLKSKEAKDKVLRVLTKYQDAVKIQSDILYGIKSESKNPIITLTNKNADKGFAAVFLAQYYNKDLRDAIAFGDQLNDYQMIQTVGHGVAMQNGTDALKFVAKGITHLSNDEGGVGHYLNGLLNGEEM